jgi:3-oxoadipate enol-lactonase
MFMEVNGHVLHVARHGSPTNPVVVLLHSLGTCAAVWERQIAVLENEYHVICPDFRGHGLSEISRDPVTIEALADDIALINATLCVERYHLCGISIGGMVAQIVASRSSHRVATLTIVDSSVVSLNPAMWRDRAAKVRGEGLPSIASSVLARWMTPAARQTFDGRALALMLERTPSEAYAAGCDALSLADCRNCAPSLTMPVTVVVGDLDEATPPSASQAIADAIGHSNLHSIAGAAHIPLFEKAQGVNDILQASLSNV